MLFATSLTAILTIFLAAAATPDGVGLHFQGLDGGDRVVAGDDQLTTPRTFFGGFVSNHDTQARTGVQRCWERVVDQLPMVVFAFESNAGHMQVAVAHVADGQSALRTTACCHAAEARRAGNGKLTERRKARDVDAVRTGRVIAGDRDLCGLGPKAGWLEPNGQKQRVSSSDGQWKRQNVGNKEFTGGRANSGNQQAAQAAVIEDEWLIDEGAYAGFAKVAGIGDSQVQMRRRANSGDVDFVRASRITAEDGDRGGLRPNGGWLKTDDHVKRFARTDIDRIGKDAGRCEIRRGRRDVGNRK